MTRPGVCVARILPASGTYDPAELITSKFVGAAWITGGGAKLARLNRLKNSVRNWTLKLSEILGMQLFLNAEKSKFTSPGPINVLRPRLPRMLGHEVARPGMPEDPAAAAIAAARTVSQPAAMVAALCCGKPKQSRLI